MDTWLVSTFHFAHVLLVVWECILPHFSGGFRMSRTVELRAPTLLWGAFIQRPLLLSQTQLDQVTWGQGCSTPVKPLNTHCRMPSCRWNGCIRRGDAFLQVKWLHQTRGYLPAGEMAASDERMTSCRCNGCVRREDCSSVNLELFPSGSCCKLVSDVSNLEWWCEGCGCIYLFLISGNSENQSLFY